MGEKEKCKGGRNFIKLSERVGEVVSNTSLRKEANMFLLGPILDKSLDSGGKLPLRGDVLRRIRGRQLEMKGRRMKGIIDSIISCPRMTSKSTEKGKFIRIYLIF